jgi:hypothetical protein
MVFAFAALAGTAPALADPGQSTCADSYDPDASYPALPDTSGPDLSGEAGVVLYLQDDRAVVELDGCLYLADRSLLIDFAGLDFVTLIVELPDHAVGAQVYVTNDAGWVETLDVSGSTFSYAVGPEHAIGFEIAAPGQSAPTGPVVVSKPSGGNPKPR